MRFDAEVAFDGRVRVRSSYRVVINRTGKKIIIYPDCLFTVLLLQFFLWRISRATYALVHLTSVGTERVWLLPHCALVGMTRWLGSYLPILHFRDVFILLCCMTKAFFNRPSDHHWLLTATRTQTACTSGSLVGKSVFFCFFFISPLQTKRIWFLWNYKKFGVSVLFVCNVKCNYFLGFVDNLHIFIYTYT